jgi:Ca-activated chloride channel family protein
MILNMKNLLIILLLITTLGLKAQYEKMEIRKGNKEYNKGAFGESELHYRKALEKDPESANANYNLGNALYKENQFEPAITKYETLTGKVTDPVKLSSFYYNMGNAYFKTQKLDKCIEAYKQSLRLNPADADAKHNLFLAQNMQKQQQQQQNKDNKDNKDKKDKDQKNKDDQKKDKDKQQEQNQKDQQKKEDKQDQQKEDKQQISKQDAERLLEAMEQDEKNVMKKVQDQKAMVRKIPVEKEW